MTKKNIIKKLLKLIVLSFIFTIFISDTANALEIKTISGKYLNKYHGYEYNLGGYYLLDENKSEIVTTLISDNDEIKFFYDDLSGKRLNFSQFVYYANEQIYKGENYIVNFTSESYVSGKYSHIISYSRRKLSKIKNDKNNYATISIKRSNNEVLTMMIKSINPLDKNKLNTYIKNLKLIEKTEKIPIFKGNLKENLTISEKVRNFYKDNFVNSDNQKFGIYEPTFGDVGDDTYLKAIEKKFDYKFDMSLSYQTNEIFLDKNRENINKLLKGKETVLKYCMENEKIPLFTISTFSEEDGKFADRTLDILDGKYDYLLNAMADNFKTVDIPILLRINNEMNGDWVPYCSHFQGKDPDIYVKSYRYIYDFFKQKNVNNVLYVFNPNNKSFPNFSFNHYLSYYPGDDYVDIVGLTAYNTGTYYSGEKWSAFEELYDELYSEYNLRFKQPFIITEFSCSSTGGDKVVWFEDMFMKMKKYPKIKYAVLWNGDDYDFSNPDDIKISRDYRIDKDEKLIEVIKKHLKNY